MAKRQSGVKEAKREVRQEVAPTAGAERQPDADNLISRIYLIKNRGVELFDGPDAEADIKAIQEISKDDDSPYTFYENGMPVYLAIKNGNYSPLVFPEPGTSVEKGEAGMTSMELYGLTVTLPSTIEKIIELETEPKPSLLDQARKIMTPTLVIVGSILVIFLLVVIMKG
jgi:hypothetical protein